MPRLNFLEIGDHARGLLFRDASVLKTAAESPEMDPGFGVEVRNGLRHGKQEIQDIEQLPGVHGTSAHGPGVLA